MSFVLINQPGMKILILIPKMQKPKPPFLHLLPLLTVTLFISLSSPSPEPTRRNCSPENFCGKIQTQTPLNCNNSSPLNQALLCKSQNLFFRTTLGLLPVTSIDYQNKTLTISHPSISTCSPSSHFISPALLSAGFPPPPQPNSLLLFNCSKTEKPVSSSFHNCSQFYQQCSKTQQDQHSSCWIVVDSDKLEVGFHPNDLKCSDYNWIYRDQESQNWEFGTRVSLGIPDHIPRLCDECSKPNGNCGIGLRCICYPKECKNRVISRGMPRRVVDRSLLLFIFMILMVF